MVTYIPFSEARSDRSLLMMIPCNPAITRANVKNLADLTGVTYVPLVPGNLTWAILPAEVGRVISLIGSTLDLYFDTHPTNPVPTGSWNPYALASAMCRGVHVHVQKANEIHAIVEVRAQLSEVPALPAAIVNVDNPDVVNLVANDLVGNTVQAQLANAASGGKVDSYNVEQLLNTRLYTELQTFFFASGERPLFLSANKYV